MNCRVKEVSAALSSGAVPAALELLWNIPSETFCFAFPSCRDRNDTQWKWHRGGTCQDRGATPT